MAAELIELERKHISSRIVSDDLVGEENIAFDKFYKLAMADSCKRGERPPNPYAFAHLSGLDLAKLPEGSQLCPAI